MPGTPTTLRASQCGEQQAEIAEMHADIEHGIARFDRAQRYPGHRIVEQAIAMQPLGDHLGQYHGHRRAEEQGHLPGHRCARAPCHPPFDEARRTRVEQLTPGACIVGSSIIGSSASGR
jgi:hypothetical protein